MKYKRIFLTVLDSFGIGELPDADKFNDVGSNTLRSVYQTGILNLPNMTKLGLFNIDGVRACEPEKNPIGVYCRSAEKSVGKDTTFGHWEIAGVVSNKGLPTYPNGFPQEVLNEIEKQTGIGAVCNLPYSGTKVINDYYIQHRDEKKMIVYTSADSVFQVACHLDVYPLDVLYSYCEKAREILNGKHGVGRVIARPFIGEYPELVRTSDRHDYSIKCPENTVLDDLLDSGYDVISVGKIYDIFAGSGITKSIKTVSNTDGMNVVSDIQKTDFNGLCFINLVDFDMKYGHRNDSIGYANALNEFDEWLGGFIECMKDDDLLIITADHGCDPKTESTDHSREYVPILCYSNNINPINLGTRASFTDIADVIMENFGLSGNSFLKCLLPYDKKNLFNIANEVRKMSYSPYSGYKVGAALLTADGKIFTGANIENSAFSPTCCAERTAVFKAKTEGENEFVALAVAGGKDECEGCTPCGVCRQVICELCGSDLPVIMLDSSGKLKVMRSGELLPYAFEMKG